MAGSFDGEWRNSSGQRWSRGSPDEVGGWMKSDFSPTKDL